MLRSILIPLDGSRNDDGAVEYSIELAVRFQAEIIGLGIIDAEAVSPFESAPIGGGAFKKMRDEQIVRRSQERIDDHLARLQIRCAESEVCCGTEQIEGPPLDSIFQHAQRCDVIVLGSESHFSPLENESCETLDQLAQMAPRPLIAVPGNRSGGSTVVVAYDGSLPAVRALQALASLGLAEGHFVHVISVQSDPYTAEAPADVAVEFLERHGLKAESHVCEGAEFPLSVIFEEAERLDAALLVMGSHGQSGWRKWLYGSATRWAVKNSRLPLFLYR